MNRYDQYSLRFQKKYLKNCICTEEFSLTQKYRLKPGTNTIIIKPGTNTTIIDKIEFVITQKRKIKPRNNGKILSYPKNFSKIRSKYFQMKYKIGSKTFQMKYQNNLSLTAKFILKNFQNKYIYYAIDDILYLLKSKPIERDNLLKILYSPILSLQNNFSVNFFDIWIREVSINEISKTNRFLKNDSKTLKQFNLITIKFFYKIPVPVKKQQSFW